MAGKVTLDQLTVQTPCNASWDSMAGNDQVRFCEHCHLTVSNLSLMSTKQVYRLIAKSKGRICVRYIRLPEGSINRGPNPARKLHQITRRASQLAAGAFTATLSVTGAVAQQSSACSGSNCNPPSSSQVTRLPARGGVSGNVTGPNGRRVGSATVSIINEETNLALYSSTNNLGEYRVDNVPRGRYNLRVEARGFKAQERNNYSLADGHSRFDVNLVAEGTPETDSNGEAEQFISIQGGASITLPTDPLIRAALMNDLEEVVSLVAGRNVNLRDPTTKTTALEHATRNANREMVQLLITAGADVNSSNGLGETVLMMLDEDATSDLVWDLLNSGARVNHEDVIGNTALIEAASENNPELLKTLLEAGAKVNAKNKDGKTALMMAAEEGLVNNLRLLVLAGAEVAAVDSEGKNALFYASENSKTATVRFLKAQGSVEVLPQEKEP